MSIELKEQFENMQCMPLFEFELPDDEWLVVDLSVSVDGISFAFDEDNKTTWFSDEIEKEGDSYLLPFDECFSLDEHLQQISEEITEGYLIPNNLYVNEAVLSELHN